MTVYRVIDDLVLIKGLSVGLKDEQDSYDNHRLIKYNNNALVS